MLAGGRRRASETCSPPEEPGKVASVLHDESEKSIRSNVFRMEEPPALIEQAIRLHSPAQERRSPRGQHVWPHQSDRNPYRSAP
jgi:hypothetical protein